MSPYASQTQVPVSRSRDQILQLLEKRGARQCVFGFDEKQAMIQFMAEGRMVRMDIPMPGRDVRGWEQKTRTRWRAVLLILLAKFEAIDAGISSFEHEFLADVVMADGGTVGRWLQPQLQDMYKNGIMPKSLPAFGETTRQK